MRHPARLAGASLLRLQSDTRLAELAVAGHVAAFDAIVDRYRTPLLRYCAGIVGPSRAEDAVQQALINAHDALQRTDEVRHLRSWLYRIAHNAALNVLRAVRDDVPLDDASLALGASGPAEAFETSERFRATVEALRELPERQRAALVLRELEGRSHEEIAAALGVTKGSARQHLMRARVAMRGAVTAITPYPIVVRLADALASPGGVGWTDAAVGAGTGATLAKLTAGVAATGALVGGAVGTHEVVHHHRGTPSASAETRVAAPARTAPAAAAAIVRHATPVVLPATAAPATGATPASDDHRTTSRHPTASRRHHHRRPEHAAPTVAPVPPTSPPLTSGTPGTSDGHSTSSGRGPSEDSDSTTSRHGSRQGPSNSGSSSNGKGSSGHGPGDSGSSSGKGTSTTNGDDTPTITTPAATAPVPTPASGSGTSGSGTSGSSGSGDSASGTSGSGSGTSTSGSGSSGSDSSGSGSSGSSDSGSSGGDGITTVAGDD